MPSPFFSVASCSAAIRRKPPPPPVDCGGRSIRSPSSLTPRALVAACAPSTSLAMSGTFWRLSVSSAWMTTLASPSLTRSRTSASIVLSPAFVSDSLARIAWTRICGLTSFISSRTSGRVERAEPFERPHRMEAPDQAAAGLGQLGQGRHHRRVLPQHQRALRGVAPPAVRVRQVADQLRRRRALHPRLRVVRLLRVVHQAPDAAVVDHLVEAGTARSSCEGSCPSASSSLPG